MCRAWLEHDRPCPRTYGTPGAATLDGDLVAFGHNGSPDFPLLCERIAYAQAGDRRDVQDLRSGASTAAACSERRTLRGFGAVLSPGSARPASPRLAPLTSPPSLPATSSAPRSSAATSTSLQHVQVGEDGGARPIESGGRCGAAELKDPLGIGLPEAPQRLTDRSRSDDLDRRFDLSKLHRRGSVSFCEARGS